MLDALNQWLLSGWLWNVTFGWYHIPISIVCMMILFKMFTKFNIVQRVFLALFSNLAAFMLYSAYVVGIVISLLKIPSTYQQHVLQKGDIFLACVSLAAVYLVLQLCFFVALNVWYKLPLVRTALITLVSSIMAALIVYWLLLIPLM